MIASGIHALAGSSAIASGATSELPAGPQEKVHYPQRFYDGGQQTLNWAAQP